MHWRQSVCSDDWVHRFLTEGDRIEQAPRTPFVLDFCLGMAVRAVCRLCANLAERFAGPIHLWIFFGECRSRTPARGHFSSIAFAREGTRVASARYRGAAPGGVRTEQQACRIPGTGMAQARLGGRHIATLRRAAFEPS